jgi:hypothetical protein
MKNPTDRADSAHRVKGDGHGSLLDQISVITGGRPPFDAPLRIRTYGRASSIRNPVVPSRTITWVSGALPGLPTGTV